MEQVWSSYRNFARFKHGWTYIQHQNRKVHLAYPDRIRRNGFHSPNMEVCGIRRPLHWHIEAHTRALRPPWIYLQHCKPRSFKTHTFRLGRRQDRTLVDIQRRRSSNKRLSSSLHQAPQDLDIYTTARSSVYDRLTYRTCASCNLQPPRRQRSLLRFSRPYSAHLRSRNLLACRYTHYLTSTHLPNCITRDLTPTARSRYNSTSYHSPRSPCFCSCNYSNDSERTLKHGFLYRRGSI